MNALDPYQTAAAQTTATRVLVTASPGTGKTSTLVARIQYMIEHDRLSPSRIVAITFTRNAAKELRDRLGDSAKGAYIGTLHAFCLRMLMEYGKALGYEADWLTIIPDEDALLDMKEVLDQLGMITRKPGGQYDWKRIGAKRWDRFWTGVTSGQITRSPDIDQPIENAVATIPGIPDETLALCWQAWDAIIARFRAQNTLTFGTLLTEAYHLLDDLKTLNYFRDRYRHFLLDEAQDSSKQEWSIIWRLLEKAEPSTMFAVGDDWQAIYGWRGAAPSIMVNLAKDPSWTVFNLAKSYRFGPGIAEPALRLIRHNKERIDKELIPCGPTPGTATAIRDMTLEDVADLIQGIANAKLRDAGESSVEQH